MALKYGNDSMWIRNGTKRKKKKTLEKIGNDCYGFCFQLEKNIYCYLCCKRVKKIEVYKGIRFYKLDEKLQFDTYRQWKQYINDKYHNYSKSELGEFSRYLNQMVRDKKPSQKHNIVIITAILTLFFSELFEIAKECRSDTWGFMNALDILVGITIIVFVFMFIGGIISTITFSIFDNNLEENFFKDYKEIIDDMLGEKK